MCQAHYYATSQMFYLAISKVTRNDETNLVFVTGKKRIQTNNEMSEF